MTPADIYDLVASRIPMAHTLQLKVDELSPSRVRLLLPREPALLNHTGTLHAAAQTAAAETAAIALGFAVLGHVEVTCQSKSIELRFRKPGRTELWASAQLPPESPQDLEARLTAEGKVDLAILVELADPAGERITEGTVTVTLRRL
jgi:acyl-coenzyme A thioesterase PaaI-like protein